MDQGVLDWQEEEWGAWWSRGLRGTTTGLHPRLFAEADGVLESMNASRLIDTSEEPGPGALVTPYSPLLLTLRRHARRLASIGPFVSVLRKKLMKGKGSGLQMGIGLIIAVALIVLLVPIIIASFGGEQVSLGTDWPTVQVGALVVLAVGVSVLFISGAQKGSRG